MFQEKSNRQIQRLVPSLIKFCGCYHKIGSFYSNYHLSNYFKVTLVIPLLNGLLMETSVFNLLACYGQSDEKFVVEAEKIWITLKKNH